MSTNTKWLLLLVVAIAPAILTYATISLSFERAKEVEFCGSCHVMTPFVDDLHDPDSDNLAAMHWDRRWISDQPCYTCHTDYDFLGPFNAKLSGMRHIAAYYLVPDKVEVKLYRPFKNGNCLACHADARSYRDNPIHELAADDIASGETSCLECHTSIHPDQEARDE